MTKLKKPLIALVLAIVPFFVFLGSTNTVTVNGVVESGSRFNILGLIFGVVAIGMAISVLRDRAPRNTARTAVAAIAGLAGLLQVASAIELVRIDPWKWINPDSDLPELAYEPGVNMDDKVFVSNATPEGYRNAVKSNKTEIIRLSLSHMAYADKCHDGRYRIDVEAAKAIPDYFEQGEKEQIQADAERRMIPAGECTPRNTRQLMGSIVDDLHRKTDTLAAFERKYQQASAAN